MKRLTLERVNGIKTGYWSSSNKEELIQALAAYENTGLTPEEIMSARTLRGCWIGVEEKLPDNEEKVLCCIADAYGTGHIYFGFYSFCQERWLCGISNNVVAWMPLPEPYEVEK